MAHHLFYTHNLPGDITCLDPALHSEVELLLENYHRQLVLIGAQINILRQRVRTYVRGALSIVICTWYCPGHLTNTMCARFTLNIRCSPPRRSLRSTSICIGTASSAPHSCSPCSPPPSPRPPPLRPSSAGAACLSVTLVDPSQPTGNSPTSLITVVSIHPLHHIQNRNERYERTGDASRGLPLLSAGLLRPGRLPLPDLVRPRPVRSTNEPTPVVVVACLLCTPFDGTCFTCFPRTRHRGQGKDRMRQDLNSVQAYQSIFKHIRSVSQVKLLWFSLFTFPQPDMT